MRNHSNKADRQKELRSGIMKAWMAVNRRWLFISLLVAGAIPRLIGIGRIPPGLNQDEASIGYDAYALLYYGIDRNGVHNPVHLISWGSGQNALYAYLDLPFIGMFGLTPFAVRAVNALFGLAGLMLFYLIARKLVNRSFALLALFLLSISPWHIMMSRWALESNVFPTLILAAVYSLLCSLEDNRCFPVSMLLFALSLYAYGTAYFFVPVFLSIWTIYRLAGRKMKGTYIWTGYLAFGLASVPIALFVLINRFKWNTVDLGFITIPRLTGTPRFDQVSSIFSGHFWQQSSAHFASFLHLMISQNDGLLWNVIPGYGFFYELGLPFLAIGFVRMGLDMRNTSQDGRFTLLAWFFAAVLLSLVVDVNTNRMNVLFYPCIFFVAYGIWGFKKVKFGAFPMIIVAFGMLFALFARHYFTVYPKQISEVFYESFGDAIEYASDQTQGDVYITDRVNMPYIYVLFYEKINPHLFWQTVRYRNPGDPFRSVDSFGRYHFGFRDMHPGHDTAYILPSEEGDGFDPAYFTVRPFKHFTVAIRKSAEKTKKDY